MPHEHLDLVRILIAAVDAITRLIAVIRRR